MGALSKKRSRSIDSLWRGNDALIAAVEAAVGISIGSDDGVLFIQDVGTKVAGRAYIDVNNGKMYRCVTGTSSTTNDSNFTELNLMSSTTDISNLQTYFITRRSWESSDNEAIELEFIQNLVTKYSTIFIQVTTIQGGGQNYSINLKSLNVKVGTRVSVCRFNSTGNNIRIYGIEANMNQNNSAKLDSYGSLIECVYNAGNVWNIVGGQGYTMTV